VALTRQEAFSSGPAKADGARPRGARALTAGAEVAERVARVAGLDRLINEAVEEAIVRALKSHAVLRAIERAAESHAVAAERGSEEVRQAVKRALESDVGGAVWAEFLESEQAQMLVERIARAPEIRSAIAAQGAGLVTDIGVRLTTVTERLDDKLEQVVRPSNADSEVDQAGLATRAVAAAIDLGLLFAAYSLLSGVIASLVSAAFGKPLSLTSDIVLGALGIIVGGAIFAAFWALAGQTPGMRFLAIRLMCHGSRDITFGRAVARVLAVLLSLAPFGLGYLAILRSPARRAWADQMTGTEVVYDSVARSASRARAAPVPADPPGTGASPGNPGATGGVSGEPARDRGSPGNPRATGESPGNPRATD
jgi:uncharacterized RDD family membrane protein YckC